MFPNMNVRQNLEFGLRQQGVPAAERRRRVDAMIDLKGLAARVDARPVTTVAVLRMVLMTLPGLNYALAMSGLRFRHYFLGTVLGLPLPTVVCCLFFDSVMRFLGVSA